MGLKGDIEDFNVSEIIQLIGQQSKTGILTARRSNKEVRIFFVNGNVVRVEPDRSERKMLMGEMLITSGKLTREQLDSALEEQKGTVQYIGEILLRRKLVSKEDIQKAVKTQIYETIYELFQWKEGVFEFETREKSKYLKILPSLSPEQLLLNVSWMVDEWQEIEKTIPTMNVVFEKIPQKRNVLLNEDQEEEDRGLTYNQKIVYDLVDGERTVQEVIERSLMGRFDTCDILSELLRHGYIRKVRIKKTPIFQRMEARSSKFLFHVLSVILILVAIYFGYRYARWLGTFGARNASDISRLEGAQIKNVAIPTLYERYLSYKLVNHHYPLSLQALSASGFISQREADVLSPKLIKAYEETWKKNSPF